MNEKIQNFKKIVNYKESIEFVEFKKKSLKLIMKWVVSTAD